eukprot:m.1434728 g.1434728  ORF g.1434728 m.1434728 type:complete len:1628 (-) comp25081_c2_seq18:2295-7178(-)
MNNLQSTDNLALLSKLDNDVLREQLKARYDEDKIYTYIGDILVAVNPFRPLPIYTQQVQDLYRRQTKSQNAPHIFAIADSAYHGMLSHRKNQCCIVSGESGAGKTESAKYVIRQIIHLCRRNGAESEAGTNISENLENKILQVNPLLEAFGNAQTNFNDNSSRFGKYTQLVFSETGNVIGARISEYLLEKSRVVDQAPGERTFHVLYYMFSNPKKDHYKLQAPETYPYFSNPLESTGVGDAKGDAGVQDSFELFAEVVTAMVDVGFCSKDRENIFKILASVLHMSRIEFKSPSALEPASINGSAAEDAIATVCDLLQLDPEELTVALLQRVNYTRGEKVVKQYTEQQALDTCDATAKALYSRLFSWLVVNLTSMLAAQLDGKKEADLLQVGILDIYGFECFETNSFEQLCINLANEYLQHFFNRHVFELELAEYESEGVTSVDVTYEDNTPLLDLFLSKPLGLLALLDEECTFPQATGKTLVAKYHEHLKKATRYLVPTKKAHGTLFEINHYAGVVEYNAEFFLEKNRDLLAPAIVKTLQHSALPMLTQLFVSEKSEPGRLSKIQPRPRPTAKASGRARLSSKRGLATPSDDAGGEGKGLKRSNTAHKTALSVGHQYKASLQDLIDNMSKCEPHFVRCIKPNHALRPRDFQGDLVMVQLKYTGMLETTRIRRDGYAVRPPWEEFIKRFGALAFAHGEYVAPTRGNCAIILEKVGLPDIILGHTKVFMRHVQLDAMEHYMNERVRCATVVQGCVRGWLTRRRTEPLLHAARQQRAHAAHTLASFARKADAFAVASAALQQEDVDRFEERKQKMQSQSQALHSQQRRERLKRAEQQRQEITALRESILGQATRQFTADSERLQAALSAAYKTDDIGSIRSAYTTYQTVLETRLTQLTDAARERRLALARLASVPGRGAEDSDTTRLAQLHTTLAGDIDAAVAHVSAHLVAVQAKHIAHQSRDLDTAVQRSKALESDTSALRVAQDRDAAAKEQQIQTLKAALEDAHAASARATAALEEHVAMETASTDELRTKHAAQTKAHAQALAALQGELEREAKSTRDAQMKVRELELASKTAEASHDEELAALRSQLREKTTELMQLEAEREVTSQEVSSAAVMGGTASAAEASSLRVQLKEHQAKQADLQSTMEMNAAEVDQLKSTLEIAKSEFAAMVADLQRTLDEERVAHGIVLRDKDAEVQSLRLKLETQQSDMENRLNGKEATVSNLEVQAMKDRVAHERVVEDLKEELRVTNEALASERSTNEACIEQISNLEVQLMDATTEKRDAIQKREDVQRDAELNAAEQRRTIAALTQTVADQDSHREVVVADHKRELVVLQEQLQAAEDAAKGTEAMIQKRVEEATAGVEEHVVEANDQLQEARATINALERDKEELVAKVQVLVTSNEEHVARETQLQFRVQQLEDEVGQVKDSLAEAVARRAGSGMTPDADGDMSRAISKIQNSQANAQEKQLLANVIRTMGRQAPGSVTPGDSDGVDLVRYVSLCLQGDALPDGIQIGRFTCKSYMNRLTGKHWHKKWMVLDLRKKLVLWFTDERELNIQKGTTEMLDIVSVAKGTGAGATTDISVQTKKRPINLRSDQPAVLRVWRAVLGAVARTRPHHIANSNGSSKS